MYTVNVLDTKCSHMGKALNFASVKKVVKQASALGKCTVTGLITIVNLNALVALKITVIAKILDIK